MRDQPRMRVAPRAGRRDARVLRHPGAVHARRSGARRRAAGENTVRAGWARQCVADGERMDYGALKLVHQWAVVLSFAGFFARGAGMLAEAAWVRSRIARTLPHVVDTV